MKLTVFVSRAPDSDFHEMVTPIVDEHTFGVDPEKLS